MPLPTLRHIFLTHHHSDHNADYGNLIWLAWAAGLSTRVDTWGPPPLAKMTKLFFEMNAYDIDTRIANEGRVPLGYGLHTESDLVHCQTGGVKQRSLSNSTSRSSQNLRETVPRSRRRTGTDPILAWPRFGANHRALPGMQTTFSQCSERSHRPGTGLFMSPWSMIPPRLIIISRLKNRVPLLKRQTASRRSVENREVRGLHYAALFF